MTFLISYLCSTGKGETDGETMVTRLKGRRRSKARRRRLCDGREGYVEEWRGEWEWRLVLGEEVASRFRDTWENMEGKREKEREGAGAGEGERRKDRRGEARSDASWARFDDIFAR